MYHISGINQQQYYNRIGLRFLTNIKRTLHHTPPTVIYSLKESRVNRQSRLHSNPPPPYFDIKISINNVKSFISL